MLVPVSIHRKLLEKHLGRPEAHPLQIIVKGLLGAELVSVKECGRGKSRGSCLADLI